MPFSHHSHSGQFCPGHAKNSLEEVIQTAIAKKFRVFCLTEHMPRTQEDLYPEEVFNLPLVKKNYTNKVIDRSRRHRVRPHRQRSCLLPRSPTSTPKIQPPDPNPHRLRNRMDQTHLAHPHQAVPIPLRIRILRRLRAPHAHGTDRL